MTVVLQHPTLGIQEVELHPAELRTLTTVRTPTETILRRIADTAIAHAEGTMHEHLELDIGHLLMDCPYLLNRELTGQYHTTKTVGAQPTHLLHRTVVGLGGRMQSERRQQRVARH